MIDRFLSRGMHCLVVTALMWLHLLPAALAQKPDFTAIEHLGAVVINHEPASDGWYVGSPSLVVLPNGNYVASHCLFGNGRADGIREGFGTKVFASTDRGQSWQQTATLEHQHWSNLFVHESSLYLLGTRAMPGCVSLRRSDDNGATWSTPANDATGFLSDPGGTRYHTAPQPLITHQGRLWRSFESFQPSHFPDAFEALVISAPVGADLLNASSWKFGKRLQRNSNWLPQQGFRGFLEGCLVLGPQGGLINVMRVETSPGKPEQIALLRVNTNTHECTLDPTHDIVEFPGAAKKFTIHHDERSDCYWSLTNPVLKQNQVAGRYAGAIRNIVALISSPDLRHWKIESVALEDLSDVERIGFQYIDWKFDGDDIVFVSRTAYPDGLGGAANHHDANMLTFHRIRNFRGTTGE